MTQQAPSDGTAATLLNFSMPHWKAAGGYPDGIGLCPGLTPDFPTLEIPLGCLVPREMDGLLAAGRNVSCDRQAHNPLLKEALRNQGAVIDPPA